MDKKSVPDGMGGFEYQWTEGAEFQAAVVKNNTLAARVAEKQGVTEVYTITTPKTATLGFNDVIKRLSDGAIFRVTSNAKDSETPDAASFSFAQVSAERWEIPK